MANRRVFVSYSQPDSATAFALVEHVEAEGVSCWVAPRDVAPGAEWAAEIVEAIVASRVMVLVLSASANRSQQVHREVERAVHHRVAVLPFRIEAVLPSRGLEYFLSTQHWLDAFPPPMGPHYARLTVHLKSLLAGAAQDADVPTGPALGSETPSPGELRIDAAPLQRLEVELAHFIGPVARHLVNRAMQRSSGVEELLDDLAREIGSQAERREFISAARRAVLDEWR